MISDKLKTCHLPLGWHLMFYLSTKRPSLGFAISLKCCVNNSKCRANSSPFIGLPWLGIASNGFNSCNRFTEASAAFQSVVKYLGGPLICSF